MLCFLLKVLSGQLKKMTVYKSEAGNKFKPIDFVNLKQQELPLNSGIWKFF